MIIERTQEELVIRLQANQFNSKHLKNIIDYLEYLEATSKTIANQDDIDELARAINKKWWNDNQYRF